MSISSTYSRPSWRTATFRRCQYRSSSISACNIVFILSPLCYYVSIMRLHKRIVNTICIRPVDNAIIRLLSLNRRNYGYRSKATKHHTGRRVMPVKKIQCADPHCDGIIAHQLTDKTFELKRLDQGVTMTGNNWSTMATCPKNPKHQTSIVVTDGKVDASILRYKEEGGEGDDEGKGGDSGEPGDGQNDDD